MSTEPKKADHLCVLVHGLWGNASHLDYVASAVKERYDEDSVYVHCAQNNSGHWTYDGVEVGGERLVHEIEETLDRLDQKGYQIKKLSIVGYSFGGLVSRYAIGLLHASGWLDKLEPVNFTTFATPHVGARTPLKGTLGDIYNTLGSKTVSRSGQQMFMVDTFRDTGRPLLSLLADPSSIFIQGLKRFRNRSVYANIVNDRTVLFYTSAISKTNPFEDPEKVRINYAKGYDDVIIDLDNYLLPDKPKQSDAAEPSQFWKRIKKNAYQVPLWIVVALVVPPAITIFFANAAVQTFRSQRRIRLHSEGKNGLRFGRYKVPLVVQNVQHVMEEAYETVGAHQEPDYLSATEEDERSKSAVPEQQTKFEGQDRSGSDSALDEESSGDAHEGKHLLGHQPTLALTEDQFGIVDSLNEVGFRKYCVYIHNHRHSHAAIIVRSRKDGFNEGKMVMKHWLDHEFEV
ncbi:hypothetical protein N7539_001982 [Penicillium diatomitis]|uniref:DUF676 domain-containing protein n=1 Tax=Penicillium diatomitis TaxID=2819901 RepID=A0A9W9XHR6_9EURO|nr:uncharacterized protein N7539_001982 [Penicillium diatomitis]KAJ5493236.1 hypothetical protein N7539_001982 [Penicillium diatomitis]